MSATSFNSSPSSPLLSSDILEVQIPKDKKIRHLPDALLPLQRQIANQYRTLPWPSQIQKIVVMTRICGGYGDISAAAKAIGVMQRICPSLTFDWVLQDHHASHSPLSFLNCADISKVHARLFQSKPSETTPADFLLLGPVFEWTPTLSRLTPSEFIEQAISRKVNGPILGFVENAWYQQTFTPEYVQRCIVDKTPQDETIDETYRKYHTTFFPSQSSKITGRISMGLAPGSGVLLDQELLEVPLSRGHCCPTYLRQINDSELREDILTAMDIFDDQTTPDYDKHSFNFGYAHRSANWGKFIDCIAVHEHDKHVVIVLNQKGAYDDLSTEQFCQKILSPKRLEFLSLKGYDSVICKGYDQKVVSLQQTGNSQPGRRMTIIVRPSFDPHDMRRLQLGAERLLATGDNSAVESWCARCKLYFYENVDNGGSKWAFFHQQVDLAKSVSPNLGKVLALFGGDKRIGLRPNEPFDDKQLAEMEQLLNDQNLTESTIQFCNLITTKYSFSPILEGAIKRAVWLHCIPKLAEVEAKTIDEPFRRGLILHLKNRETSEKSFTIRCIPELKRQVEKAVQEYVLSQKSGC